MVIMTIDSLAPIFLGYMAVLKLDKAPKNKQQYKFTRFYPPAYSLSIHLQKTISIRPTASTEYVK